MEIIEFYFAFHRRVTLAEIWRGSQDWRCIFGHVQAYGCTADATWVFFNPEGCGTIIEAMHRHDDVIDRLAQIRCSSTHIIAFKADGRRLRFPLHLPMNCVVQCAALIGRRAFSPWGFRKMLLANGAEVIFSENPQGTKERQGSAPA